MTNDLFKLPPAHGYGSISERAEHGLATGKWAQPVHACNCIGPQNGQPRCPCAMRDVRVVDGRYVLPAQDLGPA